MRSFLLTAIVFSAYLNSQALSWSNCEGPEDYRLRDGRDYRGSVSVTKSGLQCQNWDSQAPHAHSVPLDASRGIITGQNFCRNAFAGDGSVSGNLAQGPGCFTTDPNVRYELCDVGTLCVPADQVPVPCTVVIQPTGKSVLLQGSEISFSCLKSNDAAERNVRFFYSLDGTSPTASSASVTADRNTVVLSELGLAAVRVFALIEDQYPTNAAEKDFIVVPKNLQVPTNKPEANGHVYHSAVLVSLSKSVESEGTWIEYWESSSNPTTAPVRTMYTSPFWLTATTEINFQTVDTMGRKSETVTVLYDVRDVKDTTAPVIFPVDQSTFFGGVRLMIHSNNPKATVVYRLNGAGVWAELPHAPYLNVEKLGETLVEVKASAFDSTDSEIVTKKITVLEAPAIECFPPAGTYDHLITVQCKAVQPATALIRAPVYVQLKGRDDTVVSSSPNGTAFLTQEGTFTVHATTYSSANFDLSENSATRATFNYTIKDSSLPLPILTRLDGGDAAQWSAGNIDVLGTLRFNIAAPNMPEGISVKVIASVNKKAYPTKNGITTIELPQPTEAASKVYIVKLFTSLVSNTNKNTVLVTSMSKPIFLEFTVYVPGTISSGYLQADSCVSNHEAIMNLITQDAAVATGSTVDVLYQQPALTLRLGNFPSQALASKSMGALSNLLKTQAQCSGVASVDPVKDFTLKSQWQGVAVVGVPFHLQLFTAAGSPFTNGATLKLVHEGVPCDAFTVTYALDADGATKWIDLDDEGNHKLCVKYSGKDTFFRLPGVLPIKRAEDNLEIELVPTPSADDSSKGSLQVHAQLKTDCNNATGINVKFSVDAGPWQIGSCRTEINLLSGTHYVSAMAEITVTSKSGMAVRHYGRQVNAIYTIGATQSQEVNVSALSYKYIVKKGEQSAIFVIKSERKELTNDALQAVRILPANSSCTSFTTSTVGGSKPTVLAEASGNISSRQTVGALMFNAPNTNDALTVCLGSFGPIPPARGVPPFSIGALGMDVCQEAAVFNKTDGTTWRHHCYKQLGRYGGCSAIDYIGDVQRLCRCWNGLSPINGTCAKYDGPEYIPPLPELVYGSNGKAIVYGITLVVVCAFVAWLVNQNRELENEAAEQDPTSPQHGRSPSKRAKSVANEPPPRTPVDPECKLGDVSAAVVTVEGDFDLSANFVKETEGGKRDDAAIQLLRKKRTGELFLWQRKGAGTAPQLVECISAKVGIKQFRTTCQSMQRKGWKGTFPEGLEISSALDTKSIVVPSAGNQSPSPAAGQVEAPPSLYTGPKVDNPAVVKFAEVVKFTPEVASSSTTAGGDEEMKETTETQGDGSFYVNAEFKKEGSSETGCIQLLKITKNGKEEFQLWQRRGTSTQAMELLNEKVGRKQFCTQVNGMIRKQFVFTNKGDVSIAALKK